MTPTVKYGGFIAAAVLIVFGAVAIFMGFDGRSTVQSSLKLEATGGLTYSQLPRFATADGAGTSDKAAALKDAEGAVMSNPARDQWITATALSTALNVSYMADQLAIFGIVVGIALLLTGIGFAVLAGGLLGRKPRAAAEVKMPIAATPVPGV